ncbi:adenylosuccinate synthetase [Pedobacter aquatilis]|uniref:adenylosuccinate synthetase n=1 Tax=Pedobacter aquatilis TaxID=351343 RepID=UPI00292F523D|nr:adenylosuccinate synthetase [Pedobacter aquatilis]
MVEKKAFVIVGLGYGDEGKGLATDFFCMNYPDSIVIRFNGGQQAGHCVVAKDGQKHIFSNLGCGTMRGIPTFWSKYCTFAPSFFVEECQKLKIPFKFYIDPDCPVTTHYDILFNRASEITLGNSRKGSCGVGFSTTIDRELSGLKLTFSDLFDRNRLLEKLSQIRSYYRNKVNHETAFNFDALDHDIEDNIFFESILELEKLVRKKDVEIVCASELFKKMDGKAIIFEGSQGILLDQNFGNWPHITRSNTSSQNAMQLISKYCLDYRTEIIYVTRAYRTRHGAGPFPDQHRDFELIQQNLAETNKTNPYQGEMRFDFLDLNILNDAVKFDDQYSLGVQKNLLMTCIDHLENHMVKAFLNEKLVNFQYSEIKNFLNFPVNRLFFSFNKCAEFIHITESLQDSPVVKTIEPPKK